MRPRDGHVAPLEDVEKRQAPALRPVRVRVEQELPWREVLES